MRKKSPYRLVALGLLTLLLVAATAGSAWHNHDHASEFRCQVCHLGHVAAELFRIQQDILAPEVVEKLYSAQEPVQRTGIVFQPIPSRAPPFA